MRPPRHGDPGWTAYSTLMVLANALRSNRHGSLRLACKQWFHVRPEAVDDDAIALGGGMDAICLVEPRIAADPVEEERHERGTALLRHVLVHPLELRRVTQAIVRRKAHAGDEDPRARRLEAADD